MGILTLLEAGDTKEQQLLVHHASTPGEAKRDASGLRTLTSPFGGITIKTTAQDAFMRCPVSGAYIYSGKAPPLLSTLGRTQAFGDQSGLRAATYY